MAKPKPIAFMSYVRSDDRYEGRLTHFRERLSSEVRTQTGDEFPIFQDRNDILWGQSWKERIENSLDEVTFLIPILTPSFFKSLACREEVERFIDREKKIERNDLILPVYYVSCSEMDEEKKRTTDEFAKVLASRQYADWRDLRFEPFTDPVVGKRLAQLAIQIREALARSAIQPKPARRKKPAKLAKSSVVPIEQSVTSEVVPKEETSEKNATQDVTVPSPRTAKIEPPVHVVDGMYRGDFTTISEAIAAAAPGDRILVYPGLYEEGLVIDKPLEIIGEGPLGEVIVQAKVQDTILFQTTMGRVTNLTLRQMGDGEGYCVDIAQGRLELEGCDISSQSFACVAIHAGADPRLRRNRIHDGKRGGVFVYENGLGTLEDNDIFGNILPGVAITEGGNPTLRRNRIHDGKQGGVFVYENGLGTLEDNDIFGNDFAGVSIKGGGNPTLRRNRIHDGKVSGVYVYENGLGTLEDNDIFGNDLAGVTITEGGNPTLRQNTINKNGLQAVRVYDKGQGTFEDNDLRDNAKGAWRISSDSEPTIKRSGNLE